jgi:hypothetical protein
MENFDSAQEWQRLSEFYREMSDEELLILAGQYSDLTSVAQQVLSHEISHRGLEMPGKPALSAPNAEQEINPDPDSPYAEDRKLINLVTVWSMRDAVQLQSMLDSAGIPFYIGTDKAMRAEKVSSNFSDGLNVQVMKIGAPFATAAIRNYSPEDEPDMDQIAADSIAIRCPKCLSEDIVLGDPASDPETSAGSAEKLKWMCVSCSHQWEDDEVETA